MPADPGADGPRSGPALPSLVDGLDPALRTALELDALRREAEVRHAYQAELEDRVAELGRSVAWLSEVVISNLAHLHRSVAHLTDLVESIRSADQPADEPADGPADAVDG
jgi:hypothetical protein